MPWNHMIPLSFHVALVAKVLTILKRSKYFATFFDFFRPARHETRHLLAPAAGNTAYDALPLSEEVPDNEPSVPHLASLKMGFTKTNVSRRCAAIQDAGFKPRCRVGNFTNYEQIS